MERRSEHFCRFSAFMRQWYSTSLFIRIIRLKRKQKNSSAATMKERLAVGKYVSFQRQWKNFLFSSLTSKSLLFVFLFFFTFFSYLLIEHYIFTFLVRKSSLRDKNNFILQENRVLSGINKTKLGLCVYFAKCDWCGKLRTNPLISLSF